MLELAQGWPWWHAVEGATNCSWSALPRRHLAPSPAYRDHPLKRAEPGNANSDEAVIDGVRGKGRAHS